jgi:hypothetical protein
MYRDGQTTGNKQGRLGERGCWGGVGGIFHGGVRKSLSLKKKDEPWEVSKRRAFQAEKQQVQRS